MEARTLFLRPRGVVSVHNRARAHLQRRELELPFTDGFEDRSACSGRPLINCFESGELPSATLGSHATQRSAGFRERHIEATIGTHRVAPRAPPKAGISRH